MNRFQTPTYSRMGWKVPISIGIFCLILFLFLGGLSSVSQTASAQEQKSLEQAVRKSSVQCYALEGFYPESLSYLEEHYGLSYNKEKYLISYEVIASNLMPSIDVIVLNEKEVASDAE